VTEEQQALSQSSAIPADLNKRLSSATLEYSHTQVERALDQLSIKLTVAFQDQTPQCICVLPDGLMFTGMLLRRLVFPLQLYSWSQPPAQSVTDTLDLSRPILLLGAEMEHASLQPWLDWLSPGKVSCAVLLQSAEPQFFTVYAALPSLVGAKVGCGFQLDGFAANWGGLYLLDKD
jgi:hypothetical protein